MSRSSRRPVRQKKPVPALAHPAARDTAAPCPCGTGAPYGECCGRFHSGRAAAPTAEALMRSRYSAFAVHDEAYLLRTWHPSTRPAGIGLDPEQRWEGLTILAAERGSAFHSEGTVTFRARYTHRGRAGALAEHSRFARHESAWVYVDGEVTGD